MQTTRITNLLCAALTLTSLNVWAKPTQVLTQAENQLLDYFVQRCNAPTPPVTAFPIGFEHPMDLVSCEVAASYGQQSDLNYYWFSEASHRVSKNTAVDARKHRSKLGISYYQNGDRSFQAILDSAKLGSPLLLQSVLTHPDRHTISAQDLKELTKFLPQSFISLAFNDLTTYDLPKLVDALEPTIKHLNDFSPEILNLIHDEILGALINRGERKSLYKEILHLDRQRQMLLLTYLSLLDVDIVERSEVPNLKRLLQARLWSSKDLTVGVTFDNRTDTVNPAKYEPLVNYLEAMSRIDAHFRYDPSLSSLINAIDYAKDLRSKDPELGEFDTFFKTGASFVDSIPTNFLQSFGDVLMYRRPPKETWEKHLIEAESTLQVLAGFNVRGWPQPFSEEHKKNSWMYFASYTARAPRFQQFFLKANALASKFPLAGYWHSDNPDKIEALKNLITTYEDVLSKECPLNSEAMCFKYWSTFPYDNLIGGIVNNMQEFSCTIPDFLKPVSGRAANHFIFPQRFTVQCTLSDLKNLMMERIPDNHFKRDMWKILAYPTPIGGTFWGAAKIFVSEDLGVFASHILNRSKKENFAIPRDPFLVAYGADRSGWSYLQKLSELPFPETQPNMGTAPGVKLTSTLPEYAGLQSTVGNLDRAFAAYYAMLAYPENYFTVDTRETLANLYFLGRTLGIPPNYLLEHIRDSRKEKKESEPRAVKSFLDMFYETYLQVSEPLPLLPTIHSLRKKNDLQSLEKAAYLRGQLSTVTERIKEIACNYPEIRDYILDSGENFPARKSLDQAFSGVYGGIFNGTFTYYEQGNIDSICRSIQIRDALLEDGENGGVLKAAIARYDDFLRESINPFVSAGLNISDARYLDSIVAFSVASMYADREFGAIAALAILKNIYFKLTKGYVTRNSDSLRYAQSRIEKALVAVGEVMIASYVRNPSPELGHAVESWMALSLSAKHPLLNDKVKQRLMDYSNNSFPGRIKAHNDATRNLRAAISKSTTIYEYLNYVAGFSARDIDSIPHYPFLSASLFDYYNRSHPDFADTSLQFLSLSSYKESISAIGINNKREYFGDNIVVTKPVQPFIDQLLESGELTPETETALCIVFKPLHDYLHSVLTLKDDQMALFVSPSVNLFPIPLELIIGTGCSNTHVPIVLVNDFAAAVSSSRSVPKKALPTNMVAMANPMIDSGGFESLISDIRGHRLNRTRSVDTTAISNLYALPDAEVEAHNVSKLFASFDLFIGPEASISKTLEIAEMKSDSAILLATHGLPIDDQLANETPALLSIENNELGLFSSMDVYEYDLQGATVILSACDTAAGFINDPSMMFTGFVKSLSDAGTDVIFASLWPVKSYASRVFSETLFSEWSQSGSLLQSVSSAKREIGNVDRYPFVMISP